jgi:hypothetical protein
MDSLRWVKVAQLYFRLTLILWAAWFLTLVAFAAAPVQFLVWLLMLLPAVAGFVLLLTLPERPFQVAAGVGAAAAADVNIGGYGADQIRAAVKTILFLLAWQLLIGVYMALVPVHQARELVPPLLALSAIWALLSPIVGIDLRTGARRVLVVVGALIAFITIAFFTGGNPFNGSEGAPTASTQQTITRTVAVTGVTPAQQPQRRLVTNCDLIGLQHAISAPVGAWSERICVPNEAHNLSYSYKSSPLLVEIEGHPPKVLRGGLKDLDTTGAEWIRFQSQRSAPIEVTVSFTPR